MSTIPARAQRLRFLALCLLLSIASFPAPAQLDPATKQLSRDIFQQLIEINTTDSVGSTTVAANAMAQRLLDAGFPKEDVVVLGPNERKGNLVARIHGTGPAKPFLLIGHLDVVEALRSDWTTRKRNCRLNTVYGFTIFVAVATHRPCGTGKAWQI